MIQIQFRRGLSSLWTSANPILADGEMGLETNTRKIKIGDGILQWNSLVYYEGTPIDISGKVDKVTGSSLVPNTEIAKIHSNTLDHLHTNKTDLDGYDPDDFAISNHTHSYELANSNIQTHVTSSHAPSNAVALATVKADTNVADAISKKHSNTNDHASGSDDQDLSNLVVKESGKSLVSNTEISKIHVSGSDDQDLSGLVVKETGKSLVADTEITKIHSDTLDHGHTNKTTLDAYTQTEANLASAVSLKHSNSSDHSNVSDHTHTNKTTLDSIQEALTTALKTSYDGAVTHAASSHLGMAINVQALTSSPTDGQTVYFGMLPKAPVTVAATSKIYIRKACTLKFAEIYCYSGTAGTAETWSLYVRKNNTTDTLIATLLVSASERLFTNAALSISLVAGDYIEIKGVQPTWATNPLTTIYGGYLYFE